ncbi:ATP-binding cassette-type vacuolar membrane transporter Hmt1 [Basidiobolus ranarum]|uniref:ATP-binding cassette-type vacuolar membrane transporter Hmt1 n=1 Tax=Basidiobolus ranarum TaxID=34480 RepID=A0ABR2W9D7_9FUNG
MENAIQTSPHRHEAIELAVPFTLLAFTILAGIYRYFFVLRPRHSYRPLLSQETQGELVWTPKSTKLTTAIQVLNQAIQISFLVGLGIVCIRALADHVWTSSIIILYNISSWIAFMANLGMMIFETRQGGKWGWPNYAFWWLALLGESMIAYHLYQTFDSDVDIYTKIMLGVSAARYILLLFLALTSIAQLRRDPTESDLEAGISSARDSAADPSAYGTFGSDPATAGPSSSVNPEMAPKPDKKKIDLQGDPFKDFGLKIKKIIPFIWPKDQLYLKFLITISSILLILGRAINFLVPYQTAAVVRSLSGDDGQPPRLDVIIILLFAFLRYLQGSNGLVSVMQKWSWIPVEQYTTKALTVNVFEHVQNLSLHYHLNRKTGEVLSVIDRGTGAIASILGTFLFTFIPVLADTMIAIGYFLYFWNWTYAAIVFTTIFLYMVVTIQITRWRTALRREMINANNDARTKAVDSLLNFETVKYYSAESYEVDRYTNAINTYMIADYKTQTSLQYLNMMQNLIINLGLLGGSLLCAYEVTLGKRVAADFIMFLVYLNQLYGPLNFMGTYYRMLQNNFIDMEKMMMLMDQDQKILDAPNAQALKVVSGEIEFQNVSFSYDDRQVALKNVSFKVPRGKTVAFVGPSGSGKSTILRLLFRFYDVSSGRILIDGQDIASVTQNSLRQQIGVVPQDTVLFNETILYNIGYGKITAGREEIEEAAKAAMIHDKILDFPDQYDTKVGERGLRLSGGEKQRVAIARTILKNPPIVFLDEATSALDNTTESQIQDALAKMTENRTTLVIAHRLSTIVSADLILCVSDGQIVEQGTHEELLEHAIQNNGQGVYYEMWQRHIREHNSDTSTAEDVVSSGDDSHGKSRKTTKASRDPKQMLVQNSIILDDVNGKKPINPQPTSTKRRAGNRQQESEVIQVIVEPSAESESTSSVNTKDQTSVPKSQKTPLSASKRASLRKKKSSNKKK